MQKHISLDISHGPLNTAGQGRGNTGPFLGEDKRGRHTPAKKTSDESTLLSYLSEKCHIVEFSAMSITYRSFIRGKINARNALNS